MKFTKVLKAGEIPNRVFELLQESYQEDYKPIAYLSTRGGKTEIVISQDKFGINITTYINGKSQSNDNGITDLASHWNKYYSNSTNKEFGQSLYKLIWSDPLLDTTIFTEMKKESAIAQPNKPKPTTTLPDNMQWAWDPNVADWVAVLKDNSVTTPPLYDPNNQNVVNQTTSYMSTVKSASEEDNKTTYTDSDLVQYHIEKFPSGKWYYWFNSPISKRREQVGPYSSEQEAREFLKKHHSDVDSNNINEKAFNDFFNWKPNKQASCLTEFLDGPRYSKEIKIEAGLIKEGLVKYAGFDFNRGTKYAITTKGLEVLRRASESEHNEALNEREKLAYLFGFNTNKDTTLDTTGKVIKSDKKFHIHLPGSFYTQEIYGETIDDALENYGYKKDEIMEWYDDEGNGEYIGHLVECDLCGEKYEADELVSTDMGNICFKCKKGIESREGQLNNERISEDRQYLEKYLLENPELFKYQYGKDNVEEVLKELIEENPNWYKKFSSRKWTICEADGTELGEVEADSELDAKIKFGIEHPEYADSQSISAKLIKADWDDEWFDDGYWLNKIEKDIHSILSTTDLPIKFYRSKPNEISVCMKYPTDKLKEQEFVKIMRRIVKHIQQNYPENINVGGISGEEGGIVIHPHEGKTIIFVDRDYKEIDSKYEETTESHEPYPNPSETPMTDIILENHTGWVNTAEQKVTPEFAKLHSILGEYKKKDKIQNITQDGKDLLVICSPITSLELKEKIEPLGYECEETNESEVGDARTMPTYTLRIKMK